jgi:hypothetical protein
MKVDAKLAELVLLMHKFPKQNRVRIFHNERTGSTPLDSKLGTFQTVSLLHESGYKVGRTGAINAQVR